MISSLPLSVSVDLLMYLSIIRVGSVLLVLVRGEKGKSPPLGFTFVYVDPTSPWLASCDSGFPVTLVCSDFAVKNVLPSPCF